MGSIAQSMHMKLGLGPRLLRDLSSGWESVIVVDGHLHFFLGQPQKTDADFFPRIYLPFFSSLFLTLPTEYFWSLLRYNHVVVQTRQQDRLRATCPSTAYPRSSPSPIYQSRGSGDLPRPAAATGALVLIPCQSRGIPPRANLGTLSPWVHSKSQSGREFVSQNAPLPQLGAGTNH